MKCLTLVILLFLSLCATAQNTPYGFGFSGFSAENGVAQNDAFSIWNNPAMMQSDSTLVGISAENIFSSSLTNFTGSSQWHTKFGNIGIGVHRFGDKLMNETTATVGASRLLSENLQVGVGLHYFSTQAQYAESASTVYPQVGLAYQFSEQFSLGFSSRNPLSQELKEPYDQNLQSLYSLGFQYQPNTEINTSIQADMWEKDGFSAGFGVQYQPLDKFSFLLGGKTNPGFVTAGVAAKLKDMRIGIGGKQQSPLGVSPKVVIQNAF